MKKRIKLLWVIGLFAGLAVSARLAMPFVLENHINNRLQGLDHYSGGVGDIDVALWRGAYGIDSLRMVQLVNGDAEPFLEAGHIDLSVQWGALLQGAIVGEVAIRNATLRVVEAEEESQEVDWEEVDWQARLEELFPFRIDRIQLVDSNIIFQAPGIEINDALLVSEVNGSIINITNRADSREEAFADFDFHGLIANSPLVIQGRANTAAPSPLFDVNLTLNPVSLRELNPWLREYVNVDAQGGTFELYLEIAAEDGNFSGYAKPVMEEVDIYRLDESTKSVLHDVWEGLVELTVEIFENQTEEQVAARIPVQGRLENPEVDTFSAIASVLRNAFVGAFTNALDQNISLPLAGQ